MSKIIMLGMGHATVTQCYNTCFLLQSGHSQLLVDAGGGNGILRQLKAVGCPISDLHHLFVTHAHTDHILGTIWLIRMVAQSKDYEGTFHIYSHDKGILVMRTICQMTLSKKHLAKMAERVVFHELEDGDQWQVNDMHLQCFDIHSSKEKQYGFRAELPDGKCVVCLGDEPFNEANRQMASGADWLLSEAFCLYADRDIYKPYEKCHSTARDAGELAESLGCRNLLLYHSEEDTLASHRTAYAEEAAEMFSGHVVAPLELETVEL